MRTVRTGGPVMPGGRSSSSSFRASITVVVDAPRLVSSDVRERSPRARRRRRLTRCGVWWGRRRGNPRRSQYELDGPGWNSTPRPRLGPMAWWRGRQRRSAAPNGEAWPQSSGGTARTFPSPFPPTGHPAAAAPNVWGLWLAGRSEKIREMVCRYVGHVPIREVWRARTTTATVRTVLGVSGILGTCGASNASNERRRS